MAKKKKKIKYKNVLLILLVIGLIIFLVNKPSKEIKEEKFDFLNKTKEEVLAYGKEKNLEVIEEYEYNKDIEKDIVISGEIIDNKINILISKGPIDESVYKESKVNELGKVPIMMYHGIVDTTENKYTGGNVDKDGYNRTANAFREDLEFYYTSGYRMIRLKDYIDGIVDVPLGLSPIILTFDDGNQNNFNVLGRNDDGSLKIDPNCAVGILEEFKKKYPDFQVTATFFVMNDLFNQKEYNQEILDFLIENGYDIGNHTTTHPDFTTISKEKTQEVVGKMYQKLDEVLPDKYVHIIAMPFGSPYNKNHENFKLMLKGTYNGYNYETESMLRVGWESEVSPFNKNFDKTFLKRCRAYDNNGKEFDIEMVFKSLEKNKYISDGDKDLIVIPKKEESNLNSNYTNIVVYEEDV